MSIRILLADDHGIIRQGIRLLLEKEEDIEVIAEAADGREVLNLTRELKPDVVIMDISMPNLNGVDATYQLVREFNKVKVIALSIHSSRQFVTDMLKAGASGYLLKECLADELVRAIRTVTSGDVYLSPKAASTVVDNYVKHVLPETEGETKSLTEREREVLQLVAEGKSTKQIAAELHVSDKAIEATRRKIMEKIGVHSVAEMTKYAIREGLTSLES